MIGPVLKLIGPGLGARSEQASPVGLNHPRGRAAATVAMAIAMASTLAFIAAPAQAAQIHRLSKFITPPNSGTPLELAISQSTGKVYATIDNLGVVDVFEASGAPDPTHPELTEANGTTPYPFSLPYGVAVNNAVAGPKVGDTYVADYSAGAVLQFNPSGARTAQAPITAADVPIEGTAQSGDLPAVLNNGGLTPTGLTVASNGDIYVSDQSNNVVDVFESSGTFVAQLGAGHVGGPYSLALDSHGNLYVAEYGVGVIEFASSGACVNSCAPIGGSSLGVATDPEDHVYNDEVGSVTEFNSSAEPIDSFGSFSFGRGVAINEASGEVYVADEPAGQINVFESVTVSTVATGSVANLSQTSATLTGEIDPDSAHGGTPVTVCHFEFGTEESSYSLGSLPCLNAEGHEVGTTGHPIESPTEIHTNVSGLAFASIYHFRLSAESSEGSHSSPDRSFKTLPLPPLIEESATTDVHSESAILHAKINPGGDDTTYHFEYGTGTSYRTPAPVPDADIGSGRAFENVQLPLSGLVPGTTYHWRVVAKNAAETTLGPDRTFTTFPFLEKLSESCPNALARQQTGAALLLDCRSYELVSAPNTGGYNVSSDLSEGEEAPFGSYPEAAGPPRVLYSVNNGAIPGTGHPTNKGSDPYVATRTESGWSTEYVGIPANDPFAIQPFSSVPSDAGASLETFAFGAPGGCSPCFEGGYTGVPVHLPNGELVQGMAGSLDPGPAAKPAGHIGKDLSADGTHFVFGSKSKFELDGKEGEITIYDRNLSTDETHVVSKTPGGETMEEEGQEIGELDISANGSHILIGKLTGEAEGARLYHLYMNVGDSERTIDLTPGAAEGVRFDGMTSDGTKVYFSSIQHLTGEDTNHSGADIFLWEEGQPLTLISAGTEGDANSCDPVANTLHEHWNTTGTQNCGDVAIGGGGGVASGNGTFYFLSPSLLDGSGEPADGIKNAPNLYVSRPGQAPRFVATLESSLTGPLQSGHPLLRSFGALPTPSFVATDPLDGDVYVGERTTGTVYKFDSSGNGVNTWREGGKLALGELNGMATDPANGDLYVALTHEIREFSPAGALIRSFADPGTYYGSEVAVDSAGNVYLNAGSSVSKFSSTGVELGLILPNGPVTSYALDSSNGDIYVNNEGETIEQYAFNGTGEVIEHKVIASELSGITALAISPAHDVYADLGSEVLELGSSGKEVIKPFGAGILHGSVGITVGSSEDIYVGNPSHSDLAEFGPSEPSPNLKTDNPVVIDAVGEPEARHTADFQVVPSGEFAAFTTTVPLTGGESAGLPEVFRYDAASEKLDCASCNPSNAETTGGASLAANGSSLTEAGQVFFNSEEPLALRDTDNLTDTYEWEPAGTGTCTSESPTYDPTLGDCLGLISTGSSPFDSKLLGVSANGVDVFFFTRDTLASQDENGELVKIYDARVDGGFFVTPEPPPCRASDECHGAGSPPPPPPDFHRNLGEGGNEVTAAKCKKGFVEKHGKCTKKPKHRKAKHPRHKRSRRDGGKK